MEFVLLVIGLVLLVGGAEILIRGASRLALRLGLSPLIVGLTVVAFGTSSPELAVSVGASLSDRGDVAVGNVVGSNIFNILFILGITASVTPLLVSQRLIRIDVPLMVLLSALVLYFGRNGAIERYEGLVLVVGLVIYISFAIVESRKEPARVVEEYEQGFGSEVVGRPHAPWLNLGMIVGGLALLVAGSQLLVNSATEIALDVGLSELIVGLTIVAVGTSMPEVATSVIAALRGERDIAVGNAVGSNLFNLMGVLGLSAVVSPDGLNVAGAAQSFDFPVMLAVAAACLPVFFVRVVSRWMGLLFLAYYCAYVAYLLLAATKHDALGLYSDIMLVFAVPLALMVLVAILLQELRRLYLKRAE